MTNLLPTFRFRRWRLVAVILFGLVLHAPTLNMGFFADDYSQQLVLQGLADHPTMRFWNLYDFGETPRPGDSTFESGAFPWWSSDDWKGRFFRPLTSMTLWLDHAMFGGWALGYHLTSLVWYAVLLVLVWKLYQSLGLSDDAALIALLILASMDSSLLPVGWPPNRNSLIETVFLVAAILVLRRFSHRAPWFTLGVALVLAICACLAKESGVAAFVLIAITLQMMRHASPESVDARWVWIGTVVCMAAAGAHLILFVSAGYGTNTTFYPMPWKNPAAYAERLFILTAIAPLSFIGFMPTDLLSLIPRLVLPAALLCIVPGVLLARAVWKAVRGVPLAWFWVVWIVVTVLPQGSPPISDRLLFGASIGAAALLGLFLAAVWRRIAARPLPRPSRFIRSLVIYGVFVVSPISLLGVGASIHYLAGEAREALLTVDLGDQTLGRREIFILQAPNDLVTAWALPIWAVERGERNVRCWPMQLGGRRLRWTRVDERTFDIQTLDEPFFTHALETVFLTSFDPPPVGATWRTALLTVESMDSGPSGLRRFRVRCPDILGDPRYRFFAVDRSHRFQLVSPPAVGETMDLPAIVPPLRYLP